MVVLSRLRSPSLRRKGVPTLGLRLRVGRTGTPLVGCGDSFELVGVWLGGRFWLDKLVTSLVVSITDPVIR